MTKTIENTKILIITPARNEAESIKGTVESVLAQTLLPWRHYLVSDGSSDGTDETMQAYANAHSFIRYLRRDKPTKEASRLEIVSPGKVGAINAALKACSDNEWDYLAILDADVVLPPNYYERIVEEFAVNQRLGLAGGFLRNILPDGKSAPGGFLNPDSVGGPSQVFRKRCFEDIGGYRPFGNEDCIAVIQARETGWVVKSLPTLMGEHHVPFDGYAPTLAAKMPVLYRMGKMDYVMYVPAWFVLIQTAARCCSKPYLLAGLASMAGYLTAVITRPPRMSPHRSWYSRQKMYVDTLTSKLRRVVAG